jgi:endonuclease I
MPVGGEDPRLNKWQSHQRQDYKTQNAKLTQDRIDLLNAIPSWAWDGKETAWLGHYQKTLRRHKETGDCHMPESGEDLALHRWQVHQRQYYKNQKDKLTPKRINLLNAIPSWSWNRKEKSDSLVLREAA